MSLRLKVVLWLMAIVLPTVLLFSVHRMAAEKQVLQERILQRVAGRVLDSPPRRCLRHPARWRIRQRGVTGYAYDIHLQPHHRRAPKFPDKLRSVLDSEEPVHLESNSLFGFNESKLATAIRTGSQADCAVILIYPRAPIRNSLVIRTVLHQSGILVIVLSITGLLISFPLVRRIRRLTAAVASTRQSQPNEDEFLTLAESTKKLEHDLHPELQYRDELGDLARAFDLAYQRVSQTINDLRRRDQALEAYIANTTHDIAIPLTVLSHRLRSLQALNLPENSEPLLRTAVEETQYISSLIRNLGVSAKLEASEIYFRPHTHDLNQIAERVVQRFQSIAKDRNIELNFGGPGTPLPIRCDSTLIEQALNNIVQNAIQYGHPGGHVALVLEVSSDLHETKKNKTPPPQTFQIRVIDDGPGIPNELIEFVVQTQVRSPQARSRRPEGQGLGLAIVQRVCRLHHWNLQIENIGGDSGSGLKVSIEGKLQDTRKNTQL